MGVSAEDLIAALQQVPEGALLYKNSLGNLAVYEGLSYIAYVDLEVAEIVFIEPQMVQ
jgi:hypothetical protein